MPHKFNAARRHKFDKAQYRVIHWAEYNESLRQRGDLTIWVSDEAPSVWRAPRRTSRGGQRRYSDLAIETCLTLPLGKGRIPSPPRSMQQRCVKEHVAGQYGRGQGLYKYQNQTLIEQLEITPEEERHMKMLISTTEKYRRRNEKDRAARGYQSKRVERAKKIVELRRSGLSLRQIAVVVGCGHVTVANELKSPLVKAINSLAYS